jgi:hypothetical protein
VAADAPPASKSVIDRLAARQLVTAIRVQEGIFASSMPLRAKILGIAPELYFGGAGRQGSRT